MCLSFIIEKKNELMKKKHILISFFIYFINFLFFIIFYLMG